MNHGSSLECTSFCHRCLSAPEVPRNLALGRAGPGRAARGRASGVFFFVQQQQIGGFSHQKIGE